MSKIEEEAIKKMLNKLKKKKLTVCTFFNRFNVLRVIHI